MNPFVPRKHRHLLESGDGLRQLAALQISESDHLDFKLQRQRGAPDFAEKVRVAAACLGTVGVGYLVIGVDESRDGRSVATAVPGVPMEEARRLMSALEAAAGAGIDPPLNHRRARLVPLDENSAVVVLKIAGRAHYPVSVDRGNNGALFYVREAAGNHPLRPGEARVRRRDIAIRRAAKWFVPPIVVVLAALTVLGWQYRELTSRRTLTALEAAVFRAALERYPGRTVTVGTIGGDPEAAAFGRELAGVIAGAGWRVERAVFADLDGVGLILAGGQAPEGNPGGCEVPFDSAMYEMALAMEATRLGILQCQHEYPPAHPLLFVGRKPESPAARWLNETAPPKGEIMPGPLPTPPSAEGP